MLLQRLRKLSQLVRVGRVEQYKGRKQNSDWLRNVQKQMHAEMHAALSSLWTDEYQFLIMTKAFTDKDKFGWPSLNMALGKWRRMVLWKPLV